MTKNKSSDMPLSISNKVGWVYLLPTETISSIVKYSPKWMVSCVLPETKRQIIVRTLDYDEDEYQENILEIDVPSLILSHTLRKPWALNTKIKEYFSINVINPEKKTALEIIPYRFANVYSSGNICFGDVELDGLPKNLRQANNFFWSTSFNEDNSPFYDLHRNLCKNVTHEYYDHLVCDCDDGCECDCQCECCINACGCRCGCNLNKEFLKWVINYKTFIQEKKFITKNKYFCGDKYFACAKPSSAIFISNKRELLNEIPKKHWRFDFQQTPVIIGVAERNEDIWTINLGSFSFKLKHRNIKIS